MSIAKRVASAITRMDDHDPEAALFDISSAVEATAQKEYAKRGKKSYKDFIHDNLAMIVDVSFPARRIHNFNIKFPHGDVPIDENGLCSIQDIFYHAVRCGLYHEAKLPDNLKFTDEGQFRVEERSLVLPSALIYGLIVAVVVSPVNAAERVSDSSILNLGDFPITINCLWGKRSEMKWLLDVRYETTQVMNELRTESIARNTAGDQQTAEQSSSRDGDS